MTGGKFGNRQAGIERKAQVRTALAEGLRVSEDATGRKIAIKVPKYSSPGMTKVRLKPMAITIGSLLIISVVLLVRERVGTKNTGDGRQSTRGRE